MSSSKKNLGFHFLAEVRQTPFLKAGKQKKGFCVFFPEAVTLKIKNKSEKKKEVKKKANVNN